MPPVKVVTRMLRALTKLSGTKNGGDHHTSPVDSPGISSHKNSPGPVGISIAYNTASVFKTRFGW